MKALLVTSEVTYVPQNCAATFDAIFEHAASHLAGLVIIKGFSIHLLKQVAWLYFLGCRHVAHVLVRNILELPLRKRETIFERHGLPILRVKNINEPWVIRWIKRNGVDLVVNLRTRCIYRKEILAVPRLGCINIHHGILPKYRGILCDLYALAKNRPSGFSIHIMSENIDAGKILLRQEVCSGQGRHYVDYLSRAGREEGRALARLLAQVSREGFLPEGIPNECERPVYSKTPLRDDIKRLQAMEMIL